MKVDKQTVTHPYNRITLKRKEILSYAAKWINFDDSMRREINQLLKDKTAGSQFHEILRIAILIKTGSIMLVAKDCGEHEMSNFF